MRGSGSELLVGREKRASVEEAYSDVKNPTVRKFLTLADKKGVDLQEWVRELHYDTHTDTSRWWAREESEGVFYTMSAVEQMGPYSSFEEAQAAAEAEDAAENQEALDQLHADAQKVIDLGQEAQAAYILWEMGKDAFKELK